MALWFKAGPNNFVYPNHYYKVEDIDAESYEIYEGSPIHRIAIKRFSDSLQHTLNCDGWWEPCRDPNQEDWLQLDEGI